MTAKVVPLEQRRRVRVARVRCGQCGHEWIAQLPENGPDFAVKCESCAVCAALVLDVLAIRRWQPP